MLKYANETKFYRQYLRISYEFGSHLRKVGALSVDSMMDDDRPLFLLSDEAISRRREEINRYRAKVRQAKQNVGEPDYPDPGVLGTSA